MSVDKNPRVIAARDQVARCQSVFDRCQRATLTAIRELDRRTAEITAAMAEGKDPRNPANKRRRPPMLGTLETTVRTRQLEENAAAGNLDRAHDQYRQALEAAYQEQTQDIKNQYAQKLMALSKALDRAAKHNLDVLKAYERASEEGITLDNLIWRELLPQSAQYASKLDNWRRMYVGIVNGCSKS